MARFTITRGKRSPNWVLSLLATFPYDRTKEYPDSEVGAIINNVLDYVEDFKYIRRNTVQRVGVTHFITYTESSITISTTNGVPQLSISLN